MKGSPPRIRAATEADAAAILTIESVAAHRPWSAVDVSAHLRDPTRLSLVAEDGELVGHVLASAAANEGDVLSIAVHPDARCRGIGRALLLGLHARWRAVGVSTGWLEVRADNAPARALYRCEGWRDAGLRRAYYRDGVDALVMRREVV